MLFHTLLPVEHLDCLVCAVYPLGLWPECCPDVGLGRAVDIPFFIDVLVHVITKGV
jgi:hypothetical protein